ncbi:ArsR/SmtB family transcription factor [Streptosporangium subroseum]|uniref:ArsR/SmtB family transcription factor n=1 Tax=Streptosporangium subroseum TaxID=106412 RepID=UPI000B786A30|nr:winged helix-turn-helix domain-containing protein [Streptosporangium subroseum]
MSKPNDVSGDALIAALSALSNPHRLRVIAVLADGRQYVSQLAREMNMSRPLLTVHLRKLEAAGLVNGSLELSEDGKAMKFYELAQFEIVLTPETLAEAAKTLSGGGSDV